MVATGRRLYAAEIMLFVALVDGIVAVVIPT